MQFDWIRYHYWQPCTTRIYDDSRYEATSGWMLSSIGCIAFLKVWTCRVGSKDWFETSPNVPFS